MTTEELIKKVTEDMKDLLISKNRAYGDSATNPSNVFSKGSPIDSLCARIDDKLMRIQNKGINDKTEDTLSDLIGYLILLKVAIIKEKSEEYEHDKWTVENGGFVTNNHMTANSIEGLKYMYHKDNKDELDNDQ
tara:strand:- start:621 stop:1022 length:402 start_codon:yes stop_codon:yes gene_type:complete